MAERGLGWFHEMDKKKEIAENGTEVSGLGNQMMVIPLAT